MPNTPGPSRTHLDTVFGPLETRVLDALWSRATAASVRDLQPTFPGIAYTTLMTTLDRLFRKSVLIRNKSGRAFFYRPQFTRDELQSRLAGSAFAIANSMAATRAAPLWAQISRPGLISSVSMPSSLNTRVSTSS